MPKYDQSRDVLTALLESVRHLLVVMATCAKEGYKEVIKLWNQFILDLKQGGWTLRIGASIAILLLIIPAILKWKDNAVDMHKWWNKEKIASRYASTINRDYEREVRQFFDKYHERFMNRDCDWMAEVAADRAMYEKYGRTRYENYKCEEFIKTEAKWYLPYRISTPVQEDEIIRISGEAVMILERLDDGTLLLPVKFEIWKRYDWNTWHFSKKPVRIPAKILSQ